MPQRHGRRHLGLILATLVALVAAPPAAASITARGSASVRTYGSESTTALTLPVPAGAQVGDVLVASLGFGRSGATAQPTLTPPSGWTLVTRTDYGTAGALAVLRHRLTSGETAFTFKTNVAVGGTAFMTAFAGVDASSPVDASAGRTVTKRSKSIATPSITTSVAGATLVTGFYGYRKDARATSWSPPWRMTELGDAVNSTATRSGSVDVATQASAGDSGARTATTSPDQDSAIATLTALRPAGGAPVISGVRASGISTTGATIGWTTDRVSDSQVEYGTTTAYGSTTTTDAAPVTTHARSITGLAPNTVYHVRVKSRDAEGRLATSGDLTLQTRAAGLPLVIDTDVFSDADDVGALATAFGLQLKGEATVAAVLVNTRTSRPAVATASWRCTAAVTAFYGFPSVSIGTALPNNGTAVNDPDFVGPCGRLAPAGTPTPGSAVTAYRRALAAQADGSAVIVSVGYLGNLSALLSSPPDSISPLGGRDLVAQKVRLLMVMGGGYPSRAGENNLTGDPASARDVATRWPTKLVWSGYEVGDLVHTGDSISGVHPATSPVRAAYEAFVGPDNWIFSYDLTAIYHAIRPGDPLLTEVGPGRNVIDSLGGNVFQSGSGNQYYLKLSSATSLDAAIETLLDTLPGDRTPPVISGVAAGAPTTTGATVSWTTNEPATTQVDDGTTTAYGTTTAVNTTLVTAHSQALTGLSPATTYHYRVRSRDAAGNTATSPDFSFKTAASTAALLADSFDTNAIDASRWTVASAGSTVAAASQELQITHPPGAWTKGSLTSVAPQDQTGRSLGLQVKRAADSGLGGSSYGETSVQLWADDTHRAELFIGGGSLTAWLDTGSGEVNLTPSWPAYSATAMQWLRFREAGGTLFWEYAAGATAPGPWTVLASTPTPAFAKAVRLKVVAGTNVGVSDTARFDNVATS